MSNDEIKHQMDFISKQQAVFSSEMIELKDKIERTTENLDKLAVIVQHQADAAEVNRLEMRDTIGNLIIGNEAARELANRAAQLAINVSQRLTAHEQEPHK